MKYLSHSIEETQKIAYDLAKEYKDGGVVALFGNLGAGKTTFTQGFAKGLGIEGKIISPTFTVMRQYGIPGQKGGQFYHIDLYRLDDIRSIEEIGISEIFSNPNNIVFIEWAEKIEKLLPANTIKIRLTQITENSREIIIGTT